MKIHDILPHQLKLDIGKIVRKVDEKPIVLRIQVTSEMYPIIKDIADKTNLPDREVVRKILAWGINNFYQAQVMDKVKNERTNQA